MSSRHNKSRRQFLQSSGLLIGAAAVPAAALRAAQAAPAIVTAEGARPQLAQGIQIGDVRAGRALIWSRADRPARLWVEYDFDPSFANAVRIRGPHALETTDYTARLDLTGLPADRHVFVRVQFQDLSSDRVMSEPAMGHFRTAPDSARDIRFLWSGDTAGQGWGINPDFGGMRIYESMRQTRPDFFIHSGDNIYADGPIPAFKPAENGRVWRNIVTPEVSKVAETLGEFRGRYKYNLLDENVRRFNAEVPQIWQWDDHEIVNNWSDAKSLLADDRYTEKRVPLLTARGTRAFLEYAPMRYAGAVESERVYRHIPYGPLLDVFVLDMRSYRGPNTYNRQTEPGPDTAFLGAEQVEWLKRSLRASKAVWKVIAADMPLGLNVGDGTGSDWPVVASDFSTSGAYWERGWPYKSDCAVPDGDGYSLRRDCTSAPANQQRFPFPHEGKIVNEDGQSNNPNTCGDRHVLVVEKGACRLWESFFSYKLGGQWYSLATAAWDLRSNALRPREWASADAAGLPILPGLVRYGEAASGEIRHALRVNFRDAAIDTSYLWPARFGAGGGNPGAMPFGALLRLKKDFVIPDGWTTQAKAIATAAKRYGLYVADNGADFHVQGEPSVKWQMQTSLQLKTITMNEMEFVDLKSVTGDSRFSPDSMAASW